MDDLQAATRAIFAQRIIEAFRDFPVREEAAADLAPHCDREIESVQCLLRSRHWSEVDCSQFHAYYPCAFLVGKAVLTCYLPAYLLRAINSDPTDQRDDFESTLPEWLIEPAPRGEPPRIRLILEWLSDVQRALLADLFDYWAGDPLEEEDPEFWNSPWVNATFRRAKRLRAAAEFLRRSDSQFQ